LSYLGVQTTNLEKGFDTAEKQAEKIVEAEEKDILNH